MIVVLAEKPSVARDLAAVLGAGVWNTNNALLSRFCASSVPVPPVAPFFPVENAIAATSPVAMI